MKFFVLLLAAVWTLEVSAHARLLPGGTTPPRSNNPGLKTGPCGGIAKNMNPTVEFQAGQTIVVQWEETIDHPGYYELSISSDNDETFQILLEVPDTQNGRDTLPHRWQANLTLPAGLTCSSCTLRLIQWMTENPANPRPYFSCADIRIVERDEPVPMPPIDEERNQLNPPPPVEDCHD